MPAKRTALDANMSPLSGTSDDDNSKKINQTKFFKFAY